MLTEVAEAKVAGWVSSVVLRAKGGGVGILGIFISVNEPDNPKAIRGVLRGLMCYSLV